MSSLTFRSLLSVIAIAILAGMFGPASAQNPYVASHIRAGNSLPSLCAIGTGDVFFLASGTIGFYDCIAKNTWAYAHSATNLNGVIPIANGGTGTASTLTGLVRGSSSAMTSSELSGDCSTSGSNNVTCTGGTHLTSLPLGVGTGSLTGPSTLPATAITPNGPNVFYEYEIPNVNLLAAAAPTVGAPTSGGSCTAGTHYAMITFLTTQGESYTGTASAQFTCVTSTGQTVPLTVIPTGPIGTLTRNVYMSKQGTSSPYFLVGNIADNTTTIYSITTADGSLGTNTSGIYTFFTAGSNGQFHALFFGLDVTAFSGSQPTGTLDVNVGTSGVGTALMSTIGLTASGLTNPGNAAVGSSFFYAIPSTGHGQILPSSGTTVLMGVSAVFATSSTMTANVKIIGFYE